MPFSLRTIRILPVTRLPADLLLASGKLTKRFPAASQSSDQTRMQGLILQEDREGIGEVQSKNRFLDLENFNLFLRASFRGEPGWICFIWDQLNSTRKCVIIHGRRLSCQRILSSNLIREITSKPISRSGLDKLQQVLFTKRRSFLDLS